jgi:hypothetical protein
MKMSFQLQHTFQRANVMICDLIFTLELNFRFRSAFFLVGRRE